MQDSRGFRQIRRLTGTVRARVLAITLVPSVVLLALGIGASGYLITTGAEGKNWSSQMQAGIGPSVAFSVALSEERRLTLLRMGGDSADSIGLEQQRKEVDRTSAELTSLATTLRDLQPEALDSLVAAFQAFAQIPAMRQRIDAGQATSMEAYTFYNQFPLILSSGVRGLASSAPDAVIGADESTVADLIQADDAMSRGNALAAGAVARGGLTSDEKQEYSNQVGTYHVMLQELQPRLTAEGRSQYAALVAGDAWQRLTSIEQAILSGTTRVDIPAWQDAAGQVSNGLVALYTGHFRSAQVKAADAGQRTFVQSLLAGIAVLLVTILALVIAARMANRLVGRLKRLRRETLQVANEQLPRIIEQVRDGEQIDPDVDLAPLDHGQDEIGQVADAFNMAQRTATAAAINEAKTREGVSAVFLNIAYRSQNVVHRQLEILDQAERKVEDPDQLDLLFKLDHLATRARRNAENLIILSGRQPGRQWRNPVPLQEIVRSAVGETEDYARVQTGQLPEVAMTGAVVADLVHLLAELVDNATSFSPPQSRVQVSANVVGRGVVVEVEDQGIGVPKEERDLLNASLHDPPDFEVMSLTDESRLGVFVISRLAARHGIVVTLVESAYGGTRAVVLLPTKLIAAADEEEQTAPPAPQVTGRRAVFTPQPRSAPPVTPAPPVASAPPVAPAPPAPPPRERTWPVEEPAATHAPQTGAHRAGSRPPLPRRRRQENLAPQLATEPAATNTFARTVMDDDAPDRTRRALSAFQRGTHQARDEH